jgi:hypothetical protein
MAEALPQIRDELGVGDIHKLARSAVHFKRPGGSLVAVLQVQPIAYLETGEWKALDTALMVDGSGWYGAPGLPFKVHPDGRGKVGNRESRINNLPSGDGLIDGNRMVREFPFGREIYELRERRMKHDIILDSEPPASFVARIIQSGDLPAGIIEHPIVCSDAAGRVYVHDKGVGPFRAWLDDATYPVTIDPTYSSQPDSTGNDTYIYTSIATSTAGANDATLYCGERAPGTETQRILINLDFSSIPPGATPSSGAFSLWQSAEAASNTRLFEMFRQKRAWVEAQASWNNYATATAWATAGGFGANDCEQTAHASLSLSSTEANGEKQWTNFGLDALKDMWDGDWTNNGWLIKAQTETDDEHRFRSSDYATAGERPKMVIEYTTGPDAITEHATLHKHTRHPGSIEPRLP